MQNTPINPSSQQIRQDRLRWLGIVLFLGILIIATIVAMPLLFQTPGQSAMPYTTGDASVAVIENDAVASKEQANEGMVTDALPANLSAQTLATLRQVDDHPLYTMTYYGDYDRHVATAFTTPADAMPWACSLFVTFADEGQMLFGRNFDWQDNPALLLFTDPSDGYASVSMVNISYLGYPHEGLAALETTEGREALLQAPLLPFDGMNEHGLTVGMAAVNPSATPNDPEKPTVGSLRIIRLLLDQTQTIEEALDLFDQYNIDFHGGPPIHYLIADRTGASVIVEFKDGERHVLGNNGIWQSATNFYLADASAAMQQQDRRFRTLEAALDERDGLLNLDDAFDLLADVAQPTTRWSIVYGMDNGAIHVAMGRNYEQIHQFTLPAMP